METTQEFDAALEKFLAAAQANIDAHFASNYSNLKSPKLSADLRGVKYLRVVQRDEGGVHGSAWCFVDKATGDVLKCESWKKPAKGPRGSIYADTFEGYGVGIYGANYKR